MFPGTCGLFFSARGIGGTLDDDAAFKSDGWTCKFDDNATVLKLGVLGSVVDCGSEAAGAGPGVRARGVL